MVTCNLKGGLGNQMFQISATVGLSMRNNIEYCFDFDNCFTPNQGKPSNCYEDNIFKKIPKKKITQIEYVYSEPKFSYTPIKYYKNMIIDGYFQSEKYFSDYSDQIIKLFNISTEKFISNEEVTSVHIRRGDYLKFSKHHRVLDKEYYESAIKKINRGVFLFFSDDIIWVKENFKSENFFYSESTSEVEELGLMSNCTNNIIANSSFSWWGAYLNKNISKIVISPNHRYWFGESGPKDTEDLIPESWIQI